MEEKQLTTLSPDNAFVLPQADIIDRLQTDVQNGLTDREAAARQATYGKNKLADEQKTPWIIKFLNQFKDFMVLILIIASVISAFLGDWLEAVVIIAIVIVNAVLGVYQEGQAERAVEALQKLTSLQARVLRNGKQVMVDSVDLVPGDVVLLEAGDIVPADLRIVESVNLKAEEASLTGESVPVEKDAAFEATAKTGIGDRANMLFNSTSVTYGRGKGVVTGIAENTEIGRIADRIRGIKEEATPLQKNLNQLSKVLGVLCLAVCLIVFVVGVLRGGDLLAMFMTAVSLAVAAIPEGLQVVVTIVLSLGMKRMAERHAIVKNCWLETLGSVDVICSDKTGTLTQNEMTVTRIYAGTDTYELTGVGYAPTGEILLDGEPVAEHNRVLQRLLEIGCLCNDADLQKKEDGSYGILGDPTEGAMLTAGAKGGYAEEELQVRYPKKGELPFDSDRKMMSVFHDDMEPGVTLSLTKGAPDIVLDRCVAELTTDGVRPLTPERRAEILAANSGFAKQALRVLAFAYRTHDPAADLTGAETEMTFVGLMGMIDPARPEVRDAIALCHRAGIRAVMITGDHKDTAVAIAEDLGMMQAGDGV